MKQLVLQGLSSAHLFRCLASNRSCSAVCQPHAHTYKHERRHGCPHLSKFSLQTSSRSGSEYETWVGVRARSFPLQRGAAATGRLSTLTEGRALASGESSRGLRSPSLNKHTAIAEPFNCVQLVTHARAQISATPTSRLC